MTTFRGAQAFTHGHDDDQPLVSVFRPLWLSQCPNREFLDYIYPEYSPTLIQAQLVVIQALDRLNGCIDLTLDDILELQAEMERQWTCIFHGVKIWPAPENIGLAKDILVFVETPSTCQHLGFIMKIYLEYRVSSCSQDTHSQIITNQVYKPMGESQQTFKSFIFKK
jgi:hypothetical protein